jgi:MazG family protein
MRRRHPHLYGDGPPEPWEQLKRKERSTGILEGLPPTLPALAMAYRLQQRAASVGFDWPDTTGPAAKVREELAEVETELSDGGERLTDEIGDLLFAVVNLARKAQVDPGLALDRANLKFRRRFADVERLAVEKGLEMDRVGLEKLDELWNQVKAGE